MNKKVSIITVHYDDPTVKKDRNEIVEEHIDSIRKTTKHLPVELILVDNGSPKHTKEYFNRMVDKGVINCLITNKDNMHWAYAWEQAYRMSSFDLLFFTCNDVIFQKGWLDELLKLMDKYPKLLNRKTMACPYIFQKANKHNIETNHDDVRVNVHSGSNCLLIRREDYEDMGRFPYHEVGGTLWYRVLRARGSYLIMSPPKNMAVHPTPKDGYSKKIEIEVKKTLMNGEEYHLREDGMNTRIEGNI